MTLARALRLSLLQVAESSGLNRLVLDSSWRTHRLLIVCWHQVALDDEHLWNPGLCLSQSTFRSRLELLRSTGCNVLPLGDALQRIASGDLPPRAVALTIDDGESSLYLRTWPLLREFGFPATLYWTTYYSGRSHAVFDPMVSYLLWKGRGRYLELEDPALKLRLDTEPARARAFQAIYGAAKAAAWNSDAKERFLVHLAEQLQVDYAEIKRKRILHMISHDEAAAMRAQGLDLQLHTHRHRVPRDLSKPSRELEDNAAVIEAAGAIRPMHFCYPSGSYMPEFEGWLRLSGVASATTCEPGLVTRNTNPYFLPRMVDQENFGSTEFKSWLSGVAAWPRRRPAMDEHGFQ